MTPPATLPRPASRWSRLEIPALALLVAVGILARLAYVLAGPGFTWDGAWQVVLARSLAKTGTLTLPWDGSPSHHFPPLWPAFLALLLRLGLAAPWGGFAQGCLLVLVTWAGARHLWGERAAWRSAALVAVFPWFIQGESQGYTESFVSAIYAAAVWASLASLRRPRLVPLAGFLAGLVFLAKASLGAFIVLAALAGLAWRLKACGWRILRDPWYWAAGAILASIAGAWTSRNVRLFGLSGWETQPHASASLRALLASGAWPWLLGVAAVVVAGLVLVILAPFCLARHAREQSALRAGEGSGLLLAALLPIAFSVPFIAGFAFTETRGGAEAVGQVIDNANRYLLVGLVPLVWYWCASLPRTDAPRPSAAIPALATLPLAADFLLRIVPSFPHQETVLAALPASLAPSRTAVVLVVSACMAGVTLSSGISGADYAALPKIDTADGGALVDLYANVPDATAKLGDGGCHLSSTPSGTAVPSHWSAPPFGWPMDALRRALHAPEAAPGPRLWLSGCAPVG